MLAFLANELPAPLHEIFGEQYYLNVLLADPETGVLNCNRTITQGSYFYLAKRDEKLMFQGVDHIAQQVVGHLEGKQPAAVFHADCIVRGRVSFDRVLNDEIVARMQYPLCQRQKIPLEKVSTVEVNMPVSEGRTYSTSSPPP